MVLLEDRRLLEEAGWQVQVFAQDARNGMLVHKLPIRPLLPRLSSFAYCGRFVKESPASVLLAYNEPTVAMFAPSRSIIRFDWLTPLPRYWQVGWALRRFKRATYLFPSDASRRLWWGQHSHIPIAKTRVIPNGVDLQLFHPIRSERNGRRVGFAGQWISEKGLDVLIAAWSEVQRQVPNAELWLAGGPDLWQRIDPIPDDKMGVVKEVEARRSPSLRVVGVIPRDQMPAFWSRVDLACVPSVSDESFGLVALEAMACGIAVVVSDAGALPEVVGDAGVVVPRSDEKALAAVIASLLRSPTRLVELGERARRRASTFDLQKRAFELLSLIEQVADGARDGPDEAAG